jgi:hypothetical protein
VKLRFLRGEELVRLSSLIDPRPGGRVALRIEGGSASSGIRADFRL